MSNLPVSLSLKTGGPGWFETLYADPDRPKEFLSAMTGVSRSANAAAQIFPWQDYRTFVDVGSSRLALSAY